MGDSTKTTCRISQNMVGVFTLSLDAAMIEWGSIGPPTRQSDSFTNLLLSIGEVRGKNFSQNNLYASVVLRTLSGVAAPLPLGAYTSFFISPSLAQAIWGFWLTFYSNRPMRLKYLTGHNLSRIVPFPHRQTFTSAGFEKGTILKGASLPCDMCALLQRTHSLQESEY